MIKDQVLETAKHGRVRWFIIAFVVGGILMSALLAWQLAESSPRNWCVLAKQGSPELAGSCVAILIKLLEIKDHAVLGLLAIVGLSFLSLATVAMGVRITAEGPGGLKTDIGADKTTVTDGESVVQLPTPPSGDTQ